MNAPIRERALELGFDDCRFAAAAPPATAPQFQRWLQSHHHGEMAYLERNAFKRVDPQQVLAGVRSVVSLAVSYAGQDDFEKTDGVLGGPGSVQNASATPSPPNTHHALSGRSFPAKTEPRTTGTIARYARFADYHNILAGRLKSLAAFVTQLGGKGTRSSCVPSIPGRYWNGTWPSVRGLASSANTPTLSAAGWGTGFYYRRF